MSEGQILVNTDAMETTLNLLTEASTKLSLARDYYNSDKLSGTGLVTNCKEAIDEITKAVSAASGVLGEINVDVENLDTFENIIEAGKAVLVAGQSIYTTILSSGTYVSVDGKSNVWWTEETINDREKNINETLEIMDTLIEEYTKDIDQKQNELYDELSEVFMANGKEDWCGQYPLEEFENYIWSWIMAPDNMWKFCENGIYSEAVAAAYVQSQVDEYMKLLEQVSINGKSYAEFYEALEVKKANRDSLRALKYTLQQQINEIPYLRISITEEFKEYARNWNEDYNEETMTNMLSRFGDMAIEENEAGQLKLADLTQEQQIMMAYLFEKDGFDAADAYLCAIEDSINKAQGTREAEETIKRCIDKDGNVDFNAVAGFWCEGFGDGVRNFLDGLTHCLEISGEGIKDATDYKQMYLMKVLQEGGFDLLSFSYQNGVTIGNMAIPIATSYYGIISTLLMGGSIYGNEKNQALADGYPIIQAYMYGIANGLSETLLESLLGCIPGIGKAEGNFLMKMLKEGNEEWVESWFETGFRAAILDEEIDADEAGIDAITSAIMGAITSAELNGAATIVRSTIGFIYKGYHVELSLSEAKEYIKAHPEMKAQDAIQAFFETETQDAVQSDDTANAGTGTGTSMITNIVEKIAGLLGKNANTNPIISGYKFVAEKIQLITGIDQGIFGKAIDSTQNFGKLLQDMIQHSQRFENDFVKYLDPNNRIGELFVKLSKSVARYAIY